jgi:hypothetical protein
MKRAALAALVMLACSRKQASPPPGAVDAAPPEPSAIYVARTEPPSIWRVFASGKLERLHIHVDSETVDAPEGSTLPRVSPDGKQIALVRDGKLVVRDLSSGRETVTNGSLIAAFCRAGPIGSVHAPGEIIGCLPDGALLLDEAPRAQLAAKRLLRWKAGQAAEPITLPDGDYGQFDVGHSGRYLVAAVARGKQSRIVRFDLSHGTLEAVTTAGDYHWPKLSPGEGEVAFERDGQVWLRDHMVIQPADQLVNLDWIDDRTLIVETATQLTVVDTDRVVRSVVLRERGE